MKELDYMEGLSKYLVKRDEHLGLTIEQAEELVEYVRSYEDAVGMLPPEVDPIPQNIIDDGLSANYWEDEDEKK